ncbi:protein maelstrom 2 isoform X2 [Eurytemora carolleeae]|uniref:protein maelstrom 2 isoform X2 n=1 Tax=Eurytemora carolleeae TaxID=1294199 RepID=UPI000C766D51|nr:protein maelstrom 2 isoform X2 [Eurytemora carolleeae]|eukprot:XP_023345845.1 protein maelstrom 2-like isoform X2 [Eurytemora affinis]
MPPKPNGYFFYMCAMKKDIPAWRNKSMAELSELCSPSWNSMSKEDKQFYDDKKHTWTGEMPKKKKNKSVAVAMGAPLSSEENSKLSKQVDTYGRCLLDVKLAKERALENARLESVDIQNMVSDKNYKTTEFLFLATTNYCVTKRDPVVYCPAEISIGRFNLRKCYLGGIL